MIKLDCVRMEELADKGNEIAQQFQHYLSDILSPEDTIEATLVWNYQEKKLRNWTGTFKQVLHTSYGVSRESECSRHFVAEDVKQLIGQSRLTAAIRTSSVIRVVLDIGLEPHPEVPPDEITV